MEKTYESYLNGAPSMYLITKDIYEKKINQSSMNLVTKYENKKLLALYEWLSTYESMEIPQYEIKNKLRELLNE